MSYSSEKIVVAISTTALFDLSTLLACKRKFDPYKFEAYQKKHRRTLLQPGIAFELAKKLLAANAVDETLPKIEVGTFSNRFYCTDYSIKQYGLIFENDNMIVPGNGEPAKHRSMYRTYLFISDSLEDVDIYKSHGYLAAQIIKTNTGVAVNFNSTNDDLVNRINPIKHLLISSA